jgi:hypothetical protein
MSDKQTNFKLKTLSLKLSGFNWRRWLNMLSPVIALFVVFECPASLRQGTWK